MVIVTSVVSRFGIRFLESIDVLVLCAKFPRRQGCYRVGLGHLDPDRVLGGDFLQWSLVEFDVSSFFLSFFRGDVPCLAVSRD